MATTDAFFSFLSLAEQDNATAKNCLCQMSYDNADAARQLPDDFWTRVEALADAGHDYAHFILHCRYWGTQDGAASSYECLRKAIRGQSCGLAFLRLGLSYADGVGTAPNHVLASYFYEKAIALGCREANKYLDLEYDYGSRSIAKEILTAFKDSETLDPVQMERFKRRLEIDRSKGNFGVIAQVRDCLHLFYPDYDQERAIDDILNGRNTIDADLFIATGTEEIHQETTMDMLERFLSQLYAPFTQDPELAQAIRLSDESNLIEYDVNELVNCMQNCSKMYENVCKRHCNVVKKEPPSSHGQSLFPRIPLSTLQQWRRQVFQCMLSVRDVEPGVMERFLMSLASTQELLDVCERVRDGQLQTFLIYFVEMNIDICAVEKQYQNLFMLYRENRLDLLCDHLNYFVQKLTDANIPHQLSTFTPDDIHIQLK